MNEKQQEPPYKKLGNRLKTLRQKLHESVAEVSGAVEIDEMTLHRIEKGSERPAEDILMLLINHFNMQDDEAAGLWTLAGYEQPEASARDRDTTDEPISNRSAILVMAVDPRVIYSDGVQVTANKNGVVISFSQANGGTNNLTTARVGMSREQANAVMHTLHEALSRSEPRQLSDGSEASKNDSSSNSSKQA